MQMFPKATRDMMLNQLAVNFMNRICLSFTGPVEINTKMELYDTAYDAFSGLSDEEVYHRFMSEPSFSDVKTAS